MAKHQTGARNIYQKLTREALLPESGLITTQQLSAEELEASASVSPWLSSLFMGGFPMAVLLASFPHCRHFHIVEETVVSSIGNGLGSRCSQEHTASTLGFSCHSLPFLLELGGESPSLSKQTQKTCWSNALRSEMGWREGRRSHLQSQILSELKEHMTIC